MRCRTLWRGSSGPSLARECTSTSWDISSLSTVSGRFSSPLSTSSLIGWGRWTPSPKHSISWSTGSVTNSCYFFSINSTLSIAGFNIDVTMWSQQLSFIVVGIIVFSSTRGKYTYIYLYPKACHYYFILFRSSSNHVEIFHLDFLQQEFQCAGFVFLTNYG